MIPVLAAAALVLSPLAAGSAEAALPGDDGGLLAGAVITPDGLQGIATEHTDGSGLVTFMAGGGLNQGQAPSWTPDGERIIWESGEGGAVSSLPDGTGSYPINEGVDWNPTPTADGANVIASSPLHGSGTFSYRLEFSPTSWNIREHQGVGNMKPWFSEPTDGNELYPSVSSTTGAVFFEHSLDGVSDVWTDHGDRNAVPGPVIADGGQPDISPDGARLVFVRKVAGFDQLFVQAADGSGTATQVSSGSVNHDYPKWNPSGTALYYNYNAGTDYGQITGHKLVLATSDDTATPNGLAFVTQQPVPKPSPGSSFHATDPTRVLDTRNAIGVSTRTPLAASGTLRLTLPAGKPVPAGATAVVLNVTATAPTAAGDLIAYPDGKTRPTSSNLNWAAGQTIPNQVVVALGSGGTVDLFNHSSGTVHVVADVAGYFTGDDTGAAFAPAGPSRLLDTRGAIGVTTTTAVAPHATVHLQVAGRAPVPAGGVTAVVLNVTVTAPTTAGVGIVFPDGSATPTASNLNWTAGTTIANHVVARLGADGKVAFTNSSPGTVHVIADLFGYYSTQAAGALFHPLTPQRLMDTRTGAAVAANATASLDLPDTVVPPGATSVVLNVTVTQPKAVGFVSVYPDGTPRPTSSNINWTAGQTIPNLVTVPVIDGKILFFNHSSGTAHMIADVFGYYAP